MQYWHINECKVVVFYYIYQYVQTKEIANNSMQRFDIFN